MQRSRQTHGTLIIETIPYWQGHQLELYWYSPSGTVAQKTRYNMITWDDAATTITGASIHGMITAQAGTTGQIYFNGEQTHWCNAQTADAQIDSTVDIIGVLRNGQNGITIELTKFFGVIAQTGTFWAELIIDYVGTPPSVTVPSEQPDWLTPLLYLGLAVGGIAVAYYIITRYKPQIKKMLKR